MKGLAQGDLLSNRGGWKMNGVAVGSREVSFCLVLRRVRDGPMESLVTRRVEKEATGFQDGCEKWESEAAWRKGCQQG